MGEQSLAEGIRTCALLVLTLVTRDHRPDEVCMIGLFLRS
jgi:hypothetical protein